MRHLVGTPEVKALTMSPKEAALPWRTPANNTICEALVLYQRKMPIRHFRPIAAAPFLLATALLSGSRIYPVEGWGATGHEVVANVAWRLLSNRTRESIERILRWGGPALSSSSNSCPDCSPLALVADWADQARYTAGYHWSAPLHYIDVRDDLIEGGCPAGEAFQSTTLSPLCAFNYSRDCPDDFCVAGAVVNYTRQLLVPVRDDGDDSVPPHPSGDGVAEALKFLVHFVGDIHQPLHCSRMSDRGGNSIAVHWKFSTSPPLSPPAPVVASVESFHLRNRFYRKVPQRAAAAAADPRPQRRHYSVDNLHAVWDDGLIEAALVDDFGSSRVVLEDQVMALIANAAANQNRTQWNAWVACPNGARRECTTQWGQESWNAALAWAYRDVDPTQEVSDGETLSREYYRSRLPVVYERLAVAGVRLAATLASALLAEPDRPLRAFQQRLRRAAIMAGP